MPKLANSAFKIDRQDATPAAWEGGNISRTRWAKTFTGQLTGSSVVEAVMLKLDDAGPAAYVGLERIACTLDGRLGTFVLLHACTAAGDDHSTSWTIVPGSGTGELAGIRGHGEIKPNHDFVLHYDLDS
jgi:hypothetical protein